MRRMILFLILALLLAGCSSGPSAPTAPPDATAVWGEPTPEAPTATVTAAAVQSQPVLPDQTSWGSISEMLVRPKDWLRIVQHSTFALGKKKWAGTWEDARGPVDYYEMGWGTYPSMDGSTVCVPLAAEFARQHLDMADDDIRSFICFSTTHIAYENLINRWPIYPWITSQTASMAQKPVDIIFVTEPSDDELKLAKAQGVELVTKPVCRDAFVFITHKDNPVDSLTAEQIRGIYSGQITNWAQVGGDGLPIVAFQRDPNSGSQTTMEKQVMQGMAMIKPEAAQIAGDMGELVDSVAEYRNDAGSIGYTFKYYIDTLYKSADIKTIRIDGTAPDEAYIRNGAYPFATYYYGVIRAGDEERTGGLLLDWVLSDEGQRCVKQAGYCPL